VQEPLGSAKNPKEKGLSETTMLKKQKEKGEKMIAVSKEAEAEAGCSRKEAEAEAEAMRRTSHKEAEPEAEEESEAEGEDEEEYKRFKRFVARYQKEMASKAEGVESVPGGEQAQPKYTIGGSDGAAKSMHQAKSIKTFELSKKAFKENAAIEGIQEQETAKSNDLSFKSWKYGK
jgi:hypothetical protein